MDAPWGIQRALPSRHEARRRRVNPGAASRFCDGAWRNDMAIPDLKALGSAHSGSCAGSRVAGCAILTGVLLIAASLR